ncbi:MAG TPA: proline--tRNA ligase, partial [Candidatus Thermoplasmatota archaeon]|nr:proline--tRNA ligase [Candidatus Thermoplasmatota archaeon]
PTEPMVAKAEDFSGWYNELVEKAQLIDKRYPVKGMDVWRPYGLSVMRAIDDAIRGGMSRTGHHEVEFPLLIPQGEFNREADQIKGFGGEVYWVTKGGDNDLDVPLVVRPTSETAMYPMFALWVRSHKDLPLKIYQIVSVFRYETKQTRSFIRVRQIHFFEAHTAHADYEDAERQILEDLELTAALCEKLCIPYALHKRPDWDKFPGAHYTVAADAMLPELKTLQIATHHHYKDNFAHAYDIRYEAPSGDRVFAHQTTYGISERVLGAVVAVHGDDKGLMLPPGVAPHQAVIVPILFKGKEGPVLEAARTLQRQLVAAGHRVHVDERDETAGFKFNDWEMRGVPIRVELGPKDVEKQQCVLVRRDNGQKSFVPLADVPKSLHDALDAYAKGLLERATATLRSNVKDVKSPEEAKNLPGIARMGWCGDDACGKRIQDVTEKSVLGVPVDVAFGGAFDKALALPGKGFSGSCAACGKATTTPVHVAKTY